MKNYETRKNHHASWGEKNPFENVKCVNIEEDGGKDTIGYLLFFKKRKSFYNSFFFSFFFSTYKYKCAFAFILIIEKIFKEGEKKV